MLSTSELIAAPVDPLNELRTIYFQDVLASEISSEAALLPPNISKWSEKQIAEQAGRAKTGFTALQLHRLYEADPENNLAPDDLTMLSHLIKIGTAAEARICSASLPLLKSLVRAQKNKKFSDDDFLQIANLTLIKAIRKFDPTNGAKFTTYARTCIKGELQKTVNRDQSLLTGATHMPEDHMSSLMHAYDELQLAGVSPTIERIARMAGVDAKIAQLVLGSMLSLDEPVGRFGTVIDSMQSSNPNPARIAEASVLGQQILTLIATLFDNRTAAIVTGFYGLDGGGRHTQKDLAEMHGLEQTTISRTLANVNKVLREHPATKDLKYHDLEV